MTVEDISLSKFEAGGQGWVANVVEVALECRPHNLPLYWLEAVNQRWNCTKNLASQAAWLQ